MKKIIFTKINEDCWKLHVDYDDDSSAQAFGHPHELMNTMIEWYTTEHEHHRFPVVERTRHE